MVGPVDLLLIRHALPLRVERADGRPADPPLADLGHEQSRRLAEWLVAEHVDALYTSPMQRAVETAAPYAQASGLAPTVEPGVSEFDRDSASYVPMEELKAKDYDAWLQLVENGGFDDGVDPEEFRTTVVDALEGIIDAHRGETVAVVCHGGVINAWATKVVGLDEHFFFEPLYTGISRFVCSSRGHRSVMSLNEIPHLRGLTTARETFANGATGSTPA